MGHQFPRAAAAAAVALALAACGGSAGDGAPTPVLDIARDQVDEAEVDGSAEDSLDASEDSRSDDGEPADGEPDDGTSDGASVFDEPVELPPPDPSTFEGANRVVNLWVGPDGETSPIDVWGRRNFTNGPILVADGVPFGEASDYFEAPTSYSLVVVGAGAGPDGEQRAGLLNAADGEQITTIFTNLDESGAVNAPNLFERGTEQAPEPPSEGNGLVLLYAPNVRAFSDALTTSIGGDAFYVGDGSATCRTQRIEATGAAPNILGGTQQVELELPPGPATISLHPWFSPDECDQPSALDIDVDVTPETTTFVVVFSRDGVGVETMTLPVPLLP